MLKSNERKLNYKELKEEINNIINEVVQEQIECLKTNEYDTEFQELRVDLIMRLIKRQGGSING